MRRTITFFGLALWTAVATASGGEITGRVTVGGAAAAGVSVIAEQHRTAFERALAEARGGGHPTDLASSATDAGGRFRLRVAGDAGRVALRFEGPGVIPRRTSGSLDAALDHNLGDIALHRPRPLAGRVVDPDGGAAPGVEVELEAGGGRLGSVYLPVKRKTLTDLNGRFRFDDAGASRNRLTFRARGYAFEVRGAVKPGVLPQPVELKPSHSLSVVVRGPEGPVADVLVRFEGDSRSPWAATGENGRARLDDLPAGTGRLVADGGDRGVGETPRFAVPRADEGAVEIALAPGRVVEGLVLDVETREPVANAAVSLRDREGERHTATDRDGRYQFDALLPASYAVEVVAEGYASRLEAADARLSERVELDLALARASRVSGRVVDEAGRPVADATGRVSRSQGRRGRNMFRIPQAIRNRGTDFTTGEDGGFSASGLTPGDDQQVAVTHPEYGSTTLGGLTLRPGEETKDVTIVLQRGPSISGRVTDLEENPIAGAELTLERSFQGRRGGARRFTAGRVSEAPKAQSDASGSFRFGGVTPGDYALVARAPGYAVTRIDPVPLGEDGEPLVLAMPIGGTISGRVVRPDGSGAKDVFVTALDGRQMGPGSFDDFGAQTSDDGFFYLENLEAGASYVVQVMGQTGLGPRVSGVVPPAEGLEIEVTGVGRIEGHAVDESGAPLREFDVNAEYDSRTGGRFLMRAFGRGQESRVASEDGSFILDELPVGRYSIVVQANGYKEARIAGIDVEENRTTGGVEIRLSRGSAILGSVVDDAGRPVIDASISATASGQRRRFGPGGTPTARSDTDGAFELTGLAEGPYTVTATHSDFSDASETVELGEGVAQVALRLETGGLLAGTVVAQDQSPLPGAQVVLSSEGGTRSMAWQGGQGAVTDQAGRFRFDHLVEGRYTVQATYREGASPRVEVVLGASERREDILIALDAGATINGLVSGLSEAELSMVQIWASGQERYSASTRVGGDGRFELVGAPVGPLTVHASVGNMLTGSSRDTTVQTIVPEGALDIPVEVVFETGFVLSGLVTRAGEPAGQVWVRANSEGTGPHSGSASTDASGAYSIDGLPPGAYRVSSGTFRETVEISGHTTYDIELPTSTVTGQVVEAGPQSPLMDVEVSLQAADTSSSSRRGAVMTDLNGSFTMEGLMPGPYTLTARRAGFGFETLSIHVKDGATEDVLVELDRAEGVGLRVRDGMFGISLRGVNVSALDGTGITVFAGSIPLDSEGKGEIAGLKPGVYTLVVGSTGYAPVTLPGIAAPAAVVDVALTPGGRLEIHVGPETLTKASRASLSTTTGIAYRSAFGGDGSFRLNAPLRNRDHVAPGSYIFLIDGVPTETLQIAEGATTVIQLP